MEMNAHKSYVCSVCVFLRVPRVFVQKTMKRTRARSARRVRTFMLRFTVNVMHKRTLSMNVCKIRALSVRMQRRSIRSTHTQCTTQHIQHTL